MSWLKNMFRKIFKRKKPSTSRPRGSAKRSPKVLHPLAIFKEDLAFLKARFTFKFDKDHYFVLHYTAGRFKRKARDFIKSFIERGLCTYFIDQHGVIWQQFDGDKCGYHVGKNKWNGKNIGKKCAGVEVACPGKVDKVGDRYKSWFGEFYDYDEVRHITSDMVGPGKYLVKGYFVKYKPAQEKAIAELMAWHVAKGLPKENLVGHDQVAWPRGRKSDHSGSLSMPLPEFIEKRVMPLVEKYRDA